MILKRIGRRRFVALSIFLSLNLICLAFWFFLVQPLSQSAERDLSRAKSKAFQLQTQILNVKDKIKATELNLPTFQQLKAQGFIGEQNRFRAEAALENIREESGMKSASFAINELKTIEDENARLAGYDIAESDIEVSNISGYTDDAFYKMIYLLNNSFIGHIRLKNVVLERGVDLTRESLDRAADPESDVSFIDGKATLQWFTLVERSDGNNSSEGGF